MRLSLGRKRSDHGLTASREMQRQKKIRNAPNFQLGFLGKFQRSHSKLGGLQGAEDGVDGK